MQAATQAAAAAEPSNEHVLRATGSLRQEFRAARQLDFALPNQGPFASCFVVKLYHVCWK